MNPKESLEKLRAAGYSDRKVAGLLNIDQMTAYRIRTKEQEPKHTLGERINALAAALTSGKREP